MRPTWIEIDLDQLEENARELARRAGPGHSVMAVVKADAYGHGAVQSARAFLRGGVSRFAVALLEEAEELRLGGIAAPLLVQGPLIPPQLPRALAAEAEVALYSQELAEAFDAEAARLGAVLGYHLKLDTGMGRLGVPYTELGELLDRLRHLKHLRMEGLFSHLACADSPNSTLTGQQIDRFDDCVAQVREAGHSPPHVHLANSAALLRSLPDGCSLARPGLALYGYSPGAAVPSEGIGPALSLRSRIVQLKRVPVGSSVGYGATWVADREALVATAPVGYADGYPRLLGNRAEVLVGNHRAPIAGRVNMDLVNIDVSDLQGVRTGDVVTFLGRSEDGAHRIDAWELARGSDTIAWEILCRLGSRVPRVLVRRGEAIGAESRWTARLDGR
jgi:alanine racemase